MGFFSLEADTARKQNQARSRQQALAERQQKMAEQKQQYEQNPFNTLLQSFAQAAPQAAANAMGNIAVDQVRYQFGGGKRALKETERSNLAREGYQDRTLSEQMRAAKATEASNERLRDMQERAQYTAEFKELPFGRKDLANRLYPSLSQPTPQGQTQAQMATPKPSAPQSLDPRALESYPLATPEKKTSFGLGETPTLDQVAKSGFSAPEAIKMPDGSLLASEELYEDAFLSRPDIKEAFSSGVLGVMRRNEKPQYLEVNGKKYRVLSKGESKVIEGELSSLADIDKGQRVPYEQAQKDFPGASREELGFSPIPQQAAPQQRPATQPQQRPSQPSGISLGAPLSGGPRSDYGDYDYTTSTERKAIGEAERAAFKNWNADMKASSDRLVAYAAAPGRNPNASKLYFESLAESIMTLPRSQRAAALSQVKKEIYSLPSDKAAKAWNYFTGVAKGSIGKVSGKFKPRGTTVKVTPGVKIAATQKSHTGEILKYNQELKAINKEIAEANELGVAPGQSLLDRKSFVQNEMKFHIKEYKALGEKPNATEFAGEKTYELEGFGEFRLASLKTDEVGQYVGKSAASQLKVDEISKTLRSSPRKKRLYKKAIQNSDLQNKNEILKEIETLSGQEEADRLAQVIVENDIPVGGKSKKKADSASENRALLTGAKSTIRETVIGNSGLEDSATDSQVAGQLNVTPKQYTAYLNNGTTGNPRADGKIANYIKKYPAEFDIEAMETQDTTPVGYTNAIKSNPWIELEKPSGEEWFNSLKPSDKKRLVGKERNSILFKNSIRLANPTTL
jgi:hypothetical protein